ncbi:MAG: AmmeMemoRadiSam system protein B [Candidatus Zixiibacteriota bacterium]
MHENNTEIRKPSAAGTFYPSGQIELLKEVASLFAKATKPTVAGRPLALIAPHAGYAYSGKTAASAYKTLEGEQFDTVVIVSPSHTVFFKGAAVYGGAGYETPIGVVEIDRSLSEKIAGINPSVYLSNQGHASGSTRGEHALEVQLPFLQTVLGKFQLVAIVMGDQEEESVSSLGEVLASTLVGTNTLLVASSDLSHFHPERKARRLDGAMREAIEKYDPDLVMETIESGRGEACGGGPVAAVMLASKRLGGNEVRFIDYTTSGETTGDFSEVVGYLSAVVVAGKDTKIVTSTVGQQAAGRTPGEEVSEEDCQLLHSIVHRSIQAYLDRKNYEPPATDSLSMRRGVFVTLSDDSGLRGCIGEIRSHDPLYLAVARLAVAAAFEDPRFDPLTKEEFEKVECEISVLTPLERVHNFRDIRIGRDGLMIKLEHHSGLLLPQVASSRGWSVDEFLQQTCLKAGLPKNSYCQSDTQVYRFSAQVF